MSIRNTGPPASFQVYVEMPFMEDIRYFDFAPLYNDVVKPTDEQLRAVDDLIEAMTVKDPTWVAFQAYVVENFSPKNWKGT